ncbi:hypothetical protein [Vibrio metschnikovii]|uniref:hypothetical protein n=1 Tax=Vibrio metschnikovii TaxID=28172 RepID=UPI00164CD1B3|nr:hypothetical protein [Vibrio metschnikovii]MBC5832144.1 hypothetical protein [Vibrio metschnikovii]
MGKLIFVTRATQTSGKGHFFRVIRMVENLRHICDCTVVVDEDASIGYEHLKCHPYNKHSPEVLVEELELHTGDIIWFDIPDSEYSVIARFQGQHITLVSTNMFEKIGERRYENIAIYPVFEAYNRTVIDKGTIQLSGSEFISLADEFFYKGDEKQPFVLVSMGGTDPMMFTPLVLQAIAQIKNSKFVYKVILPKGARLEDFSSKYNNLAHLEIYRFGCLDFSRTLRYAKYAIINGGMTRYECVAAKVYFIALSIHKTQFDLTEKVSRYGFGKNFGVFNESCISKLSWYLEKLPATPRFEGHNDGVPSLKINGAKWIYDQILKEVTYENE